MIRAFLAILLDDPLRAELRSLQDSLRRRLGAEHDPSVRVQWVRPEALHVTVKFLGDIDEPQVEAIKAAVEPVCAQTVPVTVEFAHLGVFPDLRAPRVLWVGCRSAPSVEALVSFATAVDRAMMPLGFEQERRPFQPHLTLARIKAGERAVGQGLLKTGIVDRPLQPLSCRIARIHLMKSELRPSGPLYTPLWELNLS